MQQVKTNQYELISFNETNGWDDQVDDVNGLNLFKMHPIEVAAQSGDLDALQRIIKHPNFDPNGTRPLYFAEVGRVGRGSEGSKFYESVKATLVASGVNFLGIAGQPSV